MKPVAKKLFFIQGEVKIFHYIARHSVSMATANFIRDDFAVVERKTPVFQHYSMPHLGAYVLSMSRRIMNEVTTLAHDNGIGINYMDTDSLHLLHCEIPILSKAFFDVYGRKLVVTPGIETDYTAAEEALGRFHSDFQGKGKDYTNPVSTEFIAVGKKAYYDRLMVHLKTIPEEERTRENGVFYDHVRLKGIPTDCIVRYAEDNQMTVRDIFVQMLEGKVFEFDLVKGSIRFEMTKSFETKTRTSFLRKVQLDPFKLERARNEWSKSGWDLDMFPYDINNNIPIDTTTTDIVLPDDSFNSNGVRTTSSSSSSSSNNSSSSSSSSSSFSSSSSMPITSSPPPPDFEIFNDLFQLSNGEEIDFGEMDLNFLDDPNEDMMAMFNEDDVFRSP